MRKIIIAALGLIVVLVVGWTVQVHAYAAAVSEGPISRKRDCT